MCPVTLGGGMTMQNVPRCGSGGCNWAPTSGVYRPCSTQVCAQRSSICCGSYALANSVGFVGCCAMGRSVVESNTILEQHPGVEFAEGAGSADRGGQTFLMAQPGVAASFWQGKTAVRSTTTFRVRAAPRPQRQGEAV